MSADRLPRFMADVWPGGFVFDSVQRTPALSVWGGVVLAGGDSLYMLAAGEERFRQRGLPGEMKLATGVALEPRRRPRLAICSPDRISVLDGENLATIGDDAGGFDRLAWGTVKGGAALYILAADRVLRRSRVERGDLEEIPIEGVSCLSSDEKGTIAVLADEPEARVWATRDGSSWFWRGLPAADSTGGEVHLAIAGATAVATLADDGTTWISRKHDAPFDRCEALDGAVALAFEGTTSDAAVFAAIPHGRVDAVVRLDAKGAATRIAEIESELEGPHIGQMAWDATRSTLWAALPLAGLVKCEAPRRAGKGKRSLS
jgi:hypothetical protein